MIHLEHFAHMLYIHNSNILYSNLVVFCFKLYNTTKFQLTHVQIKILISQNLSLGVKQRSICNIQELSTMECHE